MFAVYGLVWDPVDHESSASRASADTPRSTINIDRYIQLSMQSSDANHSRLIPATVSSVHCGTKINNIGVGKIQYACSIESNLFEQVVACLLKCKYFKLTVLRIILLFIFAHLSICNVFRQQRYWLSVIVNICKLQYRRQITIYQN